MSAENTQATLLDDSGGGCVEIETDGRFIRPMLSISSAIVNEARFRFTEDGVESGAVDPSNVALYEYSVPASAFDEYDLNADEEVFVGLNLDRTESHLRDARMGKQTADDVSLRVDSTMTRLGIRRDYSQCEVERTDEWLNIDPDAIREEPGIPDLALDYKAEIDVQAFDDIVNHVDAYEDHLQIAERDGLLVMSGAAKDNDGELAQVTEARFHSDLEPLRDNPEDGSSSLFSLGYLKEFTSGLRSAKVDTVSVHWGDSFPVILEFDRTDEDDRTLYEGRYMMAPRIPGDDL